MNGSDSILTRALSFLFQRAPGAVIRNLGGRRVRRRAGRWGVAPKGRSVRNARAVRPERKPKKKKPRKSENLRGFVTAFGGDGGRQTRSQADPIKSKHLPTIQRLALYKHPIYASAFQPHPAFADGLSDGLENRC